MMAVLHGSSVHAGVSRICKKAMVAFCGGGNLFHLQKVPSTHASHLIRHGF